MNDDPIDLPMRRPRTLPMTRAGTEVVASPRPGTIATSALVAQPKLTPQQFVTVVEHGTRVAEGVLTIANGLVEISRIKAQSAANVSEIRERSLALERAMHAETDRLLGERKHIRTRGQAAVAVINSVLSQIPESDQASRQLALQQLPKLVEAVTAAGDSNVPPQS